MATRVSNRRLSQVLLVVLFALMINLPLAHSTYTAWRIEHHGDQVSALVTDHRERGSERLVQFRFPSTVDPDQTTWTAEVDQETYDDAVATGRLSVRVLADNPAAWHAEGEQTGHVALGITLIADLALIAAVLLLVRHRGRLRPELRMVAVEDVVRCPPGAALDRIDGVVYVVCGDVAEIGDDEIVLEVGERRVRVYLDGHANPVGYQQPAKVIGHMVG
jgi:hypothetical protein